MPRCVTPRGSRDDDRADSTDPADPADPADPVPTGQRPGGAPADPDARTNADGRTDADGRIGPDEVRAFATHCVTPGGSAGHTGSDGSVGIETEWLVVDTHAVHRPVPPERTSAALAGIARATPDATPVLPGGSRITYEPGGQVELSGPPLDLIAAIRATEDDLGLVRAALAADGLALVGMGVDPLRAGVRQTAASRYAAMEEHFLTGGGQSGPVMMRSTASVQVNLDLGASADAAAGRFRLAHALGPVLTAAFAASPAMAGRRTGWRSTRQAVWAGIDPSRTRSVAGPLTRPGPDGGAGVAHPGQDPDLVGRWTRYLLDAKLMMVGDPDGRAVDQQGFVAVTDGSTLADWIAGRGPVSRPPTLADLEYHATTLFPPVRPRGWWELRYLDAQPGDGWRVAVAVPTVLLDDPTAARGALEACLPAADRWSAAAMLGMRDEALRTAAARCLALAVDALDRRGAPDLAAEVASFAEHHTQRGRCPADDLSDRFAAIGPAGLLREEARSCVPAI